MGKRGPHRKAGRARHANGKIDYRSEKTLSTIEAEKRQAERANLEEVFATRMRIHGLSLEQAEHQQSASAAGRMILKDRELSNTQRRDQFDALFQYERLRDKYQTAIQSPKEGRQTGGTRGRSEYDDEAFIAFCRASVDEYEALGRRIMDEQCAARGSGNLLAARNLILDQDQEHMHMLADFRLLMSAVQRHFKIGAKGSG